MGFEPLKLKIAICIKSSIRYYYNLYSLSELYLSIYPGRKISQAELTNSRHVVLSIIAVLISKTDSRPVSFFRLSMKVKCLLPWFAFPFASCHSTTLLYI